MEHHWQLRCGPPTGLVIPAAVGSPSGPTKSAAQHSNWRRTSHNLYVPAGTDSSYVEQRILEQSTAIPGAVVTGWAALRLHGSNLCDGLAEDGRTPLDVPLLGRQSTRGHPGIDYMRRELDRSQTVVKYGITCTTPLVATMDAMCAATDLREAVVWGDIVCSAGLVSRTELVRALHRRRRTRGLATARRAAALISDRSRSPAETRLRLIWILDAGLPAPLCNWPVLTLEGRWVATVDTLGVEIGVVGEFDGRDHRSIERQAVDADRDSKLQSLGLETFRVVGRDLYNTELVVGRIRAAARRAVGAQRPQLWKPGTRPRRLAD